MNNNYSPQLNTAISAAIQAGKIIMRFYSRLENLKVMSKGHNDYVSEADQQAEIIIKETLASLENYIDINKEGSPDGSCYATPAWTLSISFSNQLVLLIAAETLMFCRIVCPIFDLYMKRAIPRSFLIGKMKWLFASYKGFLLSIA